MASSSAFGMQDSSEWSNLGLAAIGCPVYTGARCVVGDRLLNYLRKKKAIVDTQMRALYVPLAEQPQPELGGFGPGGAVPT